MIKLINRSASRATLNADLSRAILQLITKSKRPIGQGSLNLLLRKQGFTVSVPTIGRRLQELEFEGLLRKVSVDGRILTKRGYEVLERWNAEERLWRSGAALLETLKRGDKKHILNLLSARRIIEGETAALAARYATAKVIRCLEELLERQAESVKAGGLGLQEDIAFHREIARASGNEVLYSLVLLLRSHERYDLIIASMRAIVGTKLVEDHTAILNGIKSRDPRKAKEEMDEHLRKLMDDIDRYWQRRMQARSPGR